MNLVSLPFKIGVLLFFSILIVLTIGFVTYRSMQSIVASIHSEARPDKTLLSLKNISLELEKAENSIRIYSLSKSSRALRNYYDALGEIDQEIATLNSTSNNPHLQANLDSLQLLILEKQYIWNEILQINQDDVIAEKLRSLSDTLLKRDTLSRGLTITDTVVRPNILLPAAEQESGEDEDERGFFQRLFAKRDGNSEEEENADQAEEPDENEIFSLSKDTGSVDTLLVAARSNINTREIAEMITEVGHEDEQINLRIRREELRLAETNLKLTEKFYSLIETLESIQKSSLIRKAENADSLARRTYNWMGLFSAAITLLAIIVLFTVARYIRKSIAYQRALEESKREAEKLARTKEYFTANVSHEIRTPLHAIHGFLRQIDISTLRADNQEKIQVAISSSENLLRIVNDVLDFSKLEAGKIRLEKEPFDLRAIFRETEVLFREQAENNHSRLSVLVDEEVSPVLLGDPYRLKQILFNLVSNAIKFTKEGYVEVRAQQKPLYKRRIDLILTVKDSGIGIDPEKTDLIFRDYTQAEAGTTQRFGGTGLGLSIVQRIVQLFGGVIEVQSRLNEGSTFICRIPLDKGKPSQLKQSAKPAEVRRQTDFSNLRALIADDEEYNRRLLKTILDKWKMPYDEAGNGLEAVEFLKTNQYAVLLLDIRMPGLDGIKTARFVREKIESSPEKLPLIAITAANSEKDRSEYLSEGFNEVVSKPFDEAELLGVLNRLLTNGKSGTRGSIPEKKVMKKTPDAQQAIDFEELLKVSNNDKKFVREMLELFLQSFRQGLKDITNQLNENDYPMIRETAHRIASPCRHLGAMRLLSATKTLEAQSESGDKPDSIRNTVKQLNSEFRIVEKEIIGKLASL